MLDSGDYIEVLIDSFGKLYQVLIDFVAGLNILPKSQNLVKEKKFRRKGKNLAIQRKLKKEKNGKKAEKNREV